MSRRGVSYYPVEDGRSDRGIFGLLRRAVRRRRWSLVVVALVLAAAIAGVLAVSCGRAEAPTTESSTTEAAVLTTTSTLPPSSTTTTAAETTTSSTLPATTTTTIYTHPMRPPVRIVIPAIKVDAKIVTVGIDKRGAMEVPPVKYAGWYKLGPAPGESGPAVVIAHVSWAGTHGPFYSLKNLKPGAKILIYDESGDVATFVADSKETVLKTKLPTEKIWNKTLEPVIRLVTCGGQWDPVTRHYRSNIIVYGHLVE